MVFYMAVYYGIDQGRDIVHSNPNPSPPPCKCGLRISMPGWIFNTERLVFRMGSVLLYTAFYICYWHCFFYTYILMFKNSDYDVNVQQRLRSLASIEKSNISTPQTTLFQYLLVILRIHICTAKLQIASYNFHNYQFFCVMIIERDMGLFTDATYLYGIF